MPRGTSSAERARRFLALVGRLDAGARYRIADLAAELHTTEEELTADLATIATCGVAPYGPDSLVPLLIEDGWVDVWSEMPAVRGSIRLSAAETAALAAAMQTTGAGADDPLVAQLLDATASATFDAESFASTLQATTSAHDTGVFETLSDAVSNREVLAIAYSKSGTDDVTVRSIEPTALVLERGAWYVNAWCRTADDWRTFRLDRIRAAEFAGDRFEARELPSSSVIGFLSGALPVARLRFEPGEPYTEREWPGSLLVETRSDGSALVDVPYAGVEWISRQVVARLGAVVVEEPTVVIDAVRTLAQAEQQAS